MLLHASAAVPNACSLNSKVRLGGSQGRLRNVQAFHRPRTRKPTGVAFASEQQQLQVVFEPFKEVQSDLFQLPQDSLTSLARLRFADSSEGAINDQINVYYSVSYIYHALFAFFDRDNVAMLGFSEFFKEESDHRRSRAEELMKYQNKRGGRVKLQALVIPKVLELEDAVKYMEFADSLEKVTAAKLYSLQKVAEDANDPHLDHLVKGKYLAEQIEIIKKISNYVAQLRRIGEEDGFGIHYFDRVLKEEGA